jgi:hypothetical protein
LTLVLAMIVGAGSLAGVLVAFRGGTSASSVAPSTEKTLNSINASLQAEHAPKPWLYDPAGSGVSMTLAEAATVLPFSPVAPPAGVGPSAMLIVSDPNTVDKQDRGIAWLYQDASGPFAVIERTAEKTEQDLEAAVTCQPGELGCSTEGWSLGKLSGGQTALVIDGNMAVSVDWLQNSIEFLVVGPASSFSLDQAMSIANEMQTAATGP